MVKWIAQRKTIPNINDDSVMICLCFALWHVRSLSRTENAYVWIWARALRMPPGNSGFNNDKTLSFFIIIVIKRGRKCKAQREWCRLHPISLKTTAPQYQPIYRKKIKGKIVDDYSRDRAAQANKKSLALLLKIASPTPSYTGSLTSTRSFQKDTEMGKKVLW